MVSHCFENKNTSTEEQISNRLLVNPLEPKLGWPISVMHKMMKR